MAECWSPGSRKPALRDRRNPTRRCHLTNALEHFPAPCAGKGFEDVVRPRMRGRAALVRFADDFVMTLETHYDAKRVMDVLGKRLDRFGLKLHPDKTSFIEFCPQRYGGA